ncbi:MAG: PDZ domain-containing protein [Candidatus Scalinduaceae bacterium]
MYKIRQITIIILILFSVFCAEISEATALLPGLTLHKEKDSVVVLDVARGSKTWDVGIRIGDILLKIDDQEIKTLDDYVKKTKSTSSDETVTLIFLRHGEEYVIIKDSNNYHKKNKVIEQNEKTITPDNEISTEKQSPPYDGIKGDTNELIIKLDNCVAGVIVYGAFNTFGITLWGLIIESNLYTDGAGKDIKLEQLKVKDNQVSIHLITDYSNAVFNYLIDGGYAFLVNASVSGVDRWSGQFKQFDAGAREAWILLTVMREDISASKLTDKEIEKATKKAIKSLENATN